MYAYDIFFNTLLSTKIHLTPIKLVVIPNLVNLIFTNRKKKMLEIEYIATFL